MKKMLLGLLLVTAFSATVRAADHAADEAALRKSSDEFVASWNKNDYKALAAKFTVDGDLINPAGRQAKGTAEIEKLFQDEQTTVMKGSTFSNTVRSIQWVAEVPVVTWDSVITGMHDPTGNALPPFKCIVTIVYAKKDGKWLAANGRPMAPLAPLPPAGAPAK
jgi:uncharacterized protein (TIGR02246 family)